MFTNCREAINCILPPEYLYTDGASPSDSNGAIIMEQMHWSV